MSRFEKMRMSARLRETLEDIARMCNDMKPHEAGDALEVVLGYPVGDCMNPIERPDAIERRRT